MNSRKRNRISERVRASNQRAEQWLTARALKPAKRPIEERILDSAADWEQQQIAAALRIRERLRAGRPPGRAEAAQTVADRTKGRETA